MLSANTHPWFQFLGLTINLSHMTTPFHPDANIHTSKSLLAQQQNRLQELRDREHKNTHGW